MVQASANAVFYASTYHPIQAGSIDGTDTTPHDNAVHRALIASATGLYDPTGDTKAEGDPYCTIFVGRLSRTTTESTLREAMSKYGRIKRLRIVRDIVTGASQGYAFVEFERDKDMLKAYEAAHMSSIDGRTVLVDYNRQQLMPGWIPRRLGGGFGGRKESGQLRFGGRERPFRAPLRPIPHAELDKLGIPLPPEGNYLARYQMPPPPRRRAENLDGYSNLRRASAERSQLASARGSNRKYETVREPRMVESGSEVHRSRPAENETDRGMELDLRQEVREQEKLSRQVSRVPSTGGNGHSQDSNERDRKRHRDERPRDSSRRHSRHREDHSHSRHSSSRRLEHSSDDQERHKSSRHRERDRR